MSSYLKIFSVILLIACASAFAPVSNQQQQRSSTALNIIPISNGPILNSKQAKAAGIGGLNGTKDLTSGGLGAFGVKGKSTPDKKNTNKKAGSFGMPAVGKAKAPPAKKAAEAKKPVNLFTKMPWSK